MKPVNLEQKNKIIRIAFTGGPCSGKTTCINQLRQALSNQFQVFLVPEIFTLAGTCGVTIPFTNMKDEDIIIKQALHIQAQIQLEEYFNNFAIMSQKECVLLIDRTPLDCKAYIGDKLWKQTSLNYGLSEQFIRDIRYDIVLHLVTFADELPQYYTLQGNQARTETPDQAIQWDQYLQNAYQGHKYQYIVPPNDNFEERYNNILTIINNFINKNPNQNIFLIDEIPQFPNDVNLTQINQYYNFKNNQYLLKQIQENTENIYQFKENLELKNLSQEDYNLKLQEFDKKQICCEKKCFIFQKQHIEIHQFQGLSKSYLRVLSSSPDKIIFPQWIKIIKELQDNLDLVFIAIKK